MPNKPASVLFSSARWHFLFLLLLGVLTAAAFMNAAPDVFINDDRYFVPQEAAFNLHSLLQLFRENAWASSGVHSDLYRPLFLVSLAAEAAVHGMRARWFHVTNIVLHVTTTIVLFELLLSLLRGTQDASPAAEKRQDPSLLPAFLAALLFGLHPIHTEVVNSVFNRSEMMATLGVLGAIWVVWRFIFIYPVRAWAVAALLYFAALLCRESAAVLPLLVFLVVVSLRPELLMTWAGRWRLLPALLLCIVAGGYLLLRHSALAVPGISPSPGVLTHPSSVASIPIASIPVASIGIWRERLSMALGVLREGLRFTIWPHPLRAIYSKVGTVIELQALLFHGLVIGSAVMARRSAPGFLLGLSFYYVAMLPATRLLTAYSSAALAERYLYLPSVGFALALAFLFRQAAESLPARKRWITAAASGIAMLFFALTTLRNADWKSEEALWEAETRVEPSNTEGWSLLASTYQGNGRVADAVRICDNILPRDASSARLQTNCAIAYQNLHRYREAESAYRRAVELGLGAVAHANLARFYASSGRRQEAENEYLRAIETELDLASQHYRRGQYLLRFHPERSAEAEGEFRRALELQPRFAPARVALDALLGDRQAPAGGPANP